MNQSLPKRAQFHHMKDGTRDDWEIIGAKSFEFRAQYVVGSRNIFCSSRVTAGGFLLIV